jgi:hypothetical protein
MGSTQPPDRTAAHCQTKQSNWGKVGVSSTFGTLPRRRLSGLSDPQCPTGLVTVLAKGHLQEKMIGEQVSMNTYSVERPPPFLSSPTYLSSIIMINKIVVT